MYTFIYLWGYTWCYSDVIPGSATQKLFLAQRNIRDAETEPGWAVY